MTLLVLYLLLAIGVSFVCSIAEAVILSVRPLYVARTVKEGRRGAKTLKRLRDNPDRPLAAILTANTIAHTVGAAGVGAQAAAVFGNQYLGLVSAVLTLLILILSEIIPKTLGAAYWKELALFMGLVIHGMTLGLYPLVWLSEKLTRLFSRGGREGPTFSREELAAMAEIGAQEGALETKEQAIVSNLLKLNRLTVRDVMTPRPVVFAAPRETTVGDHFEAHADVPFSRLPTYGENVDNVTGYVLKSDILLAQARDQFDRKLAEFERELPVVPDRIKVSALFDQLMHAKSHLALVVDEHGTVQGLVTQEDVLETLIGLEIMDELDTVEDLRSLALKRWQERMKALGIKPENLAKAGKKTAGPIR